MSPSASTSILVALDPAQGAEIKKTTPCVVVSPDEINRTVQTVLVAPMTTTIRRYPFRVGIRFEERDSHIAIDSDSCRRSNAAASAG